MARASQQNLNSKNSWTGLRDCVEKVEPLEFVFPYAIRSRDPVVKSYARERQQKVGGIMDPGRFRETLAS
jgi:hypothetical protein